MSWGARAAAWRERPPAWLGLTVLGACLVAGAATETTGADAEPRPTPLRGSAASIDRSVVLQYRPAEDDVNTGAHREATGSVRGLDGTAAGPTARLLLTPRPELAGLDPRTSWQVDAAYEEVTADPRRRAEAACGRVVALAPRTGRPLPELEEEAAVDGACATLLGVAFPDCDPSVGCAAAGRPGDPARVDELVAAARVAAAESGVARPVTRLQAAVIGGTTTRSVVRVRLQRGEEPVPGATVRAAYPGGDVLGVTGSDGRAELALPDVALRDPLPVDVVWRGVLPVGTALVQQLLPLTPQEIEAQLEPVPEPAWLLTPVPYELSVRVRRDARG